MSSTDSPDIALHDFTDLDHAALPATYVAALEAFDRLPLLRELKALAIERTGTGPGSRVLDVGCGFGLETLRLARRVQPGGAVTGVDLSADFVAEGRRRAAAEGVPVELLRADARHLPFADASFDVTRIERVLIYLDDPWAALREIVRVTRPGGVIAIIAPDFDTNTVNVPDEALARAVLAHECDTAVVHGLLARDLRGHLLDLGVRDVRVASRMVVFDPDLAAQYFTGIGRSAGAAGVIDQEAATRWVATIAELHRTDRLFAAIGYYLFTGRVG
ncbi:methyltransferase domain-containing protein [Pseudonocardia halophobica]|uniref:Methyltransferase n=1 Tax=Pseudonocardia halophobica TaxID=29401 RepID=A0A9W6P071_9PSEU|nr:methyltransferase domain-containing protein [Pseudonocardia halophobica]GLL15376.1 methyltransferase [Pseudonocardia halophobica]